LFEKLLQRGMPKILVRILSVWYCNQQFYIRWGNTVSSAFNVSNGVRQGGILSPFLFNVYIDDLSTILNECNVGCVINGHNINHLIYADDTVIIAPSSQALQVLLANCDKYAYECDIVYNEKKTVCMAIRPKCMKFCIEHPIFLSNKIITYVKTQKYLGVCISSNMEDDKIYIPRPLMFTEEGILLINILEHVQSILKFNYLNLIVLAFIVLLYGTDIDVTLLDD
jgi:hypothetical protein